MSWNWEKPDWPNFVYDSTALEPLEKRFLLQSGEFVGAFKHIGADDQDTLKIEIIGDEAVKTSEIEGEILDRDSVQSSLRHQLRLGAEKRLARARGRPSMIALAYTIERKRKDYYASLERSNKETEITGWLEYFA